MRRTPFARPGTWPWLLAHELRLLWRSFGIRSRVIAALGVVFLLLAHAGGYLMARTNALHVLIERSPASAITISVFVILLVVSSAFGLAVRVLVERGDLDLLLTSPVPMTTIYAVRGLTVAAASVGSMALFVLPLADMGPFAGDWRLLAAWPTLAAIGLAAAALALAATLALVRWLGVRRARVASQVLGATVGIGFVLTMQLQPLLSARHRHALAAWLRAEEQGGWLSHDSPLLWPMRAFVGETLPLVLLVLIGVGLFVLVVRGSQAAFLRALQDAPQVPARRMREARTARPFRSGLARVVVAKEMRLLARDPALLARTLLQVVYLVPLFIIMVRKGQTAAVIAAGLVVLASGVGSTLAWMAVSGEEAPELLRSAPVDLERVRWLKVLAALFPAAALTMPFLVWLARESVAAAATAGLFVVLALASCAVVQAWSTALGGGRDPGQRFRRNPFVSIAETLCSFAWAGACWLAFMRSAWAVPVVAFALVAPAAAWLSARRQRD